MHALIRRLGFKNTYKLLDEYTRESYKIIFLIKEPLASNIENGMNAVVFSEAKPNRFGNNLSIGRFHGTELFIFDEMWVNDAEDVENFLKCKLRFKRDFLRQCRTLSVF